MSDIKILRSFVKFTPSFDENEVIPIDENKEFRIYFYPINKHYDFSITISYKNGDNSGRVPLFTHFRDNTIHLWDFMNHKILHPADFQDLDDTSLVLRYGREILDKNFIDINNKSVPLLELELSDFTPFFELVGL